MARQPAGQFPYSTGRGSAEQLGYSRDALELILAAVVDRFVGVVTRDIPEGVFAAGNPCRVIREITESE